MESQCRRFLFPWRDELSLLLRIVHIQACEIEGRFSEHGGFGIDIDPHLGSSVSPSFQWKFTENRCAVQGFLPSCEVAGVRPTRVRSFTDVPKKNNFPRRDGKVASLRSHCKSPHPFLLTFKSR